MVHDGVQVVGVGHGFLGVIVHRTLGHGAQVAKVPDVHLHLRLTCLDGLLGGLVAMRTCNRNGGDCGDDCGWYRDLQEAFHVGSPVNS